MTALGIDLKEVRVLGDEEKAIVDALNATAASLHLCLHHRRDRAHPQYYRQLRGEGIRRAVMPIRARSPSCTNG